MQIYLIASQRIASLSKCELRSSKFARFEPVTRGAVNLQISNFRVCDST